MSESKWSELKAEFQSVLGGRVHLLDVILPPLLFTLANRNLPLLTSLIISLGSALLILIYRIARKRPVAYALTGIGAIALAALLAWLTQSAEGYFLPRVVMDGLVLLGCIVSALLKRPLAAWSSHLTRGWPPAWYWHERVRPAYTEVTWAWSVYFLFRFGIQLYLYLQGSAQTLGAVQLLTGWPLLILVLGGSYIYGTWRLQQLAGPGVEEFEAGAEPPWEGQQRGF
jgi:hypothetical protein